MVKEARREWVEEVTLSTGTTAVLLFADEMVMMAETREALQRNVEAINEALMKWDLKVNRSKTR